MRMLAAFMESPSIRVYHIFSESMVCCMGMAVVGVSLQDSKEAILVRATSMIPVLIFVFVGLTMFSKSWCKVSFFLRN